MRIVGLCISLMFRGVFSVWKNDLDPVLAKILIKERENSGQLVDCGICDAPKPGDPLTTR